MDVKDFYYILRRNHDAQDHWKKDQIETYDP